MVSRQGGHRALIALAGLAALIPCSSASAEPLRPHAPAQSPADYYWTIERPTQQIPRAYEDVHDLIYSPLDNTRVFVPEKTAASYPTAALKIWSSRGDPVASYILGAQLLGSFEAQRVNDEDLQARLPMALPFFRRAASPAKCPALRDPAARQFLGCGRGLAEAQYILSVCEIFKYPGCNGDLNAARRWCVKSRDQGFTPSDHNCPKRKS